MQSTTMLFSGFMVWLSFNVPSQPSWYVSTYQLCSHNNNISAAAIIDISFNCSERIEQALASRLYKFSLLRYKR